MKRKNKILIFTVFVLFIFVGDCLAQIGKRFPSEKKIVKDRITGVDLHF